MDFNFWNFTSSGDVVYKDTDDVNTDDVNTHGYWFIFRFCGYFTGLSR
jgi:hypothetical protein